MGDLQHLIQRISVVTAGRAPVELPSEPAPGRPGCAGATPTALVETLQERLMELRDEGDTEPSLVQVCDADAAREALAAAIAGVPRTELLVPGDPMERRDYRVGITPAVALIAETGSAVLDVPDLAGGWASLAVETHWVCASLGDLEPDLVTFYASLAGRIGGELGRTQVQITGASRTADVEKIIVVPAHGPTRLVVLLADQPVDWDALCREVAGPAQPSTP